MESFIRIQTPQNQGKWKTKRIIQPDIFGIVQVEYLNLLLLLLASSVPFFFLTLVHKYKTSYRDWSSNFSKRIWNMDDKLEFLNANISTLSNIWYHHFH